MVHFFFKPWGLPSGSLGATTWSCARGRHWLEEISRWLLALYFSLMVRFGLLWDLFDGEIWWDLFCIVVFITFPRFLSQHNLALGSTWHVYIYIYTYMFVCLSIQSCTWEIRFASLLGYVGARMQLWRQILYLVDLFTSKTTFRRNEK